jgi:DNA-binding NtrC family response regulator
MRWVVCCTGRLQELLSSTRVRPDLLARLMRYELHVPPVRQRRSDIPSMMTALIGRTAAAEGLRAPRLAEDACALLWRQSYPGNLRDLESLACTLVLHLRREEIHAPELQQCATAFGMPLAERVQSRHPNREVVLDALWATRTGSGRTNKTRAAEWLGWDPDTMVAKMKALKIPDEVPCQTSWEQAPWEATPKD